MFDTTQSDPNGVQRFTGEGTHHLHVIEVYEDDEKWEVYYQSIASADNPADVGARGKETIWKPTKNKPDYYAGAINRALHFCCAVGLYSKEQWAADKAAGRGADVDPMHATGRDLVAKVKLNDNGYPKLAMTWNRGDKAVEKVPRGVYEGDAPAMAGAGAASGAATASGDDFGF